MLQDDSMLQHSNLVYDIIERFEKENLLSKKLPGRLKSVNLKSPKFLYIKKITQKDK